MKPETIKRLVDEYQGEDLSRTLYNAIKSSDEIEKSRKFLYRKKSDILSEREKELNEVEDSIQELQERCPHYEITYFPDASGNNDSSSRCDTCEKRFDGRHPEATL